ncbi:glycosyltransferase family 4 protein [Fructilactobacillus fructivorans]|uniref:Glycosyltransferase LafB, responsible for the formation of Gal-Glc-DAG n=1 Tax=Fructilactobacillus fructivorans TaxID=1614 RepID=A0A0C1LXB0_9LACO|nr:glycosyltransferase family 4 protein [Fructilactobacillus fructivorans]KID41325.1 Glycosyltransferase LafB, responsible for the formation of Gal-Glc-DAG [Fructilactobacillus fructivorans]MCT0151788.1 glycosyltransferase [Fructilactobacillus fructivorans]MCT2867084.1 glycosyltransferase [Fructilactobacillus fructivorans]MCT2868356.1 glycosyltransferase [Fructilactobacillus fructivorans]MCT2873064.1 glycosyltransferase [Fructilactobacillus fructivorans]
MLKIDMFSTADKVKGQGVGSAYVELIAMLKKHFPNDFDIEINKFNRSDISHYHTINPSFYLSTFSKKRGRKIGYVHFLPETLEGSLKIPTPFRQIFYKYVVAFYKRMDHIVVVNPMFIPKLEKYGIDKQKITYIPNFVSKKEFYPISKPQKKQLRDQYGYDENRFTVLGTGQVQTRKGVIDFGKLAKQNPDIQFIWAGGFSFGKMTDGYSELKKLVDNPPQNLSFPGIVDRKELVNYYNMADLFLLPSYNELFPMSVLEAFSCGIPVMLRNLSLYKKIIDGYYISANNEVEMDKKLKVLLNDPNLLKQYAEKSLKASDYYSEDHLAKIWHDFYFDQAKKG